MSIIIETVENVHIRTSAVLRPEAHIWLIHGYASSELSFRPLMETALAERFNLYAPDFPGFGASPFNPEISSLEACAGLLKRLIARLSHNAKIFLVSHSLGSIFAVWAANDLKNQMGGLFSIEGNLTADDAFFSGLGAAYDDANRFKQVFLEKLYPNLISGQSIRDYYASVCHAHPDALLGWSRSAARFSTAEASGRDFVKLGCPKLYYWGASSTHSNTQSSIRELKIPNLEYVEGGHSPMIERPERCARDILEFIQTSG